jgi:hypothetical protein
MTRVKGAVVLGTSFNTLCHVNSGSNSGSCELKAGRIGPELAIWLASNARCLRDAAELRDEHRS